MFVMGNPDRLAVTPDRLTAEKISLGGWDIAAKHNLEMITGYRNSTNDYKKRIAELQARIDNENMTIDSLMGAVMLGGDLGGSDEAAQAG
jgi:hypothetical protein